jgi:hypothetical protein
MYRQGLGDCFLLTFRPDTPEAAHVLVDLGTISRGEGVPMDDVVADIRETTGGRLRAVVATHEHLDHISGFERLANAGVRADEAWLSWTEDGDDPLARKLQKYEGDLHAAVQQSALAIDAQQRTLRALRDDSRRADPVGAREADERAAHLDALNAGIRDLLEFQGLLPPEKSEEPGASKDRNAKAREDSLADRMARAGGSLKATANRLMQAVRDLAGGRVRFLSPGQVLERPWAPGVRVFVLGPPRDLAAIQRLGQHGSPDLYELAFAVGAELPAAEGAPRDSWEPFDHECMFRGEQARSLGGVVTAYERDGWRQVEEGKAGAAAELALQLDNATNNTSLVLALEVGEEVLLFPGDAQLGSWLTWPDVRFEVREDGRRRIVRGERLLRRTTFYKVGHHASHNATSRPGLELMGERGLTAFIPLDEQAARNRGWPMPARALHRRLHEKTHGRVIKSDGKADPDEAPSLAGIRQERTYMEVTLPAGAPPSTGVPRGSSVAVGGVVEESGDLAPA